MRKRDETKSTKIMDAVVDIILHEGAGAVSTIKIAKVAGMTQSNVYLYFKNKAEILNGVYDREMQAFDAIPAMTQVHDPALSTAQRLNVYFQAILDYALVHPSSLTVVQQIKALQGHPLMIQDVLRPDMVVRDLITTGIAEHVLKNAPANLLMGIILTTINIHVHNLQTGLYSRTKYPDEVIISIIWDAIKAAAEPK